MRDELVSGIRLKLQRAEDHGRELERLLQEFKDRKGLEATVELDTERCELDDGEVWQVVTVCDPGEQPDPYLGLVAGDALHNFRSALDHVATALVLANGEEPTTKTAFPLDTRTPDKRRLKHLRAQVLAGMAPDWCDLILERQPHLDESDPLLVHLGRLGALDNLDKHRGVHPATTVLQGAEWPFFPGRSYVLRPSLEPIVAGSEVFRYMFTDDPETRFEGEVDLRFDTTFGLPQFHGIDVVEISEIGQAVFQVINEFAEAFA